MPALKPVKDKAPRANETDASVSETEEGGESTAGLAARAYDAIEARIVQLKYPPGHLLAEQQLSQELGVSRTPIREALRRLAIDKLVQVLPRKGAFVTEIEIKQYLHLLDLRFQLELFAATRSAKRSTEEERAKMRQLISELRAGVSAPDQSVFVYADRAYKGLIVEASRNPFVGSIIAPMHAHSRRFWYYYRHQWAPDEAETAIFYHLQVMQAVADGDEAAAERTVRELFAYLEGFAHRVLRSEHTI